jgi:hypothetical protein
MSLWAVIICRKETIWSGGSELKVDRMRWSGRWWLQKR